MYWYCSLYVSTMYWRRSLLWVTVRIYSSSWLGIKCSWKRNMFIFRGVILFPNSYEEGIKCDLLLNNIPFNHIMCPGDIAATSEGERVISSPQFWLFQILDQDTVYIFVNSWPLFCLQIYCIFLFFCAVSLFGTIVAEVNEIVAHLNAQKKDLDQVLEPYLAINPRYRPMTWWYCNGTITIDILKRFGVWGLRLEAGTMFNVRSWERFRFLIEQEHLQVTSSSVRNPDTLLPTQCQHLVPNTWYPAQGSTFHHK